MSNVQRWCLGFALAALATPFVAYRCAHAADNCPTIHDDTAPSVTLGEDGIVTLEDAMIALKPVGGGVILVPVGAPVECDELPASAGKYDHLDLTIRGIPEDGKLPRFSCLDVEKGGPHERVPNFANLGGPVGSDSNPDMPDLDVSYRFELIEIHGYHHAAQIKNLGNLVFVDVVITENKDETIKAGTQYGKQWRDTCIDRSTITGSGLWSTAGHCIYLGSDSGQPGSYENLTITNSVIGDCMGSGIKTASVTAHTITDNIFVGPFEGGQIDIPACSQGAWIERNQFAPGKAIDLRDRRSRTGCPDYPDFFDVDKPVYVNGNTFISGTAIKNHGTRPLEGIYGHNHSVFKTLPEGWRERSVVYAEGNDWGDAEPFVFAPEWCDEDWIAENRPDSECPPVPPLEDHPPRFVCDNCDEPPPPDDEPPPDPDPDPEPDPEPTRFTCRLPYTVSETSQQGVVEVECE